MISSIDEEIPELAPEIDPSRAPLFQNHTNVERLASTSTGESLNSKDNEQGDLLAGFPNRTVASSMTSSQKMGGGGAESGAASSSMPSWGQAKQRNSVSLNLMAVRNALAGLIDSDGDDGDDIGDTKPIKEESKVCTNPSASGGPEHRPLVGGFAAAAYEAARVDYYKKRGIEHVRGHPQAYHRCRNP
jgi:hypothetical protein